MITCVIIEDQPPAQRILKKYIGDINYLELKETFSDAIHAMEYLKHHKVDVIFLDIHLPKISGIDFLSFLPHPPAVILTTAYPEYALKGYELNVTDYLLKPFSFERFLQAISKLDAVRSKNDSSPANIIHETPDTIFVKSGHEHLNIKPESILFIKSELDYTEIHLKDAKHLTSQSLKYWLQKLPKKQFAQVHRSYIVNVTAISKVSGNQIFFDDETIVPIGRAYRESFVNDFLQS
ncbi:LytR/AlgR family response regulator transcription factor [Aureibacter tunicatorum]|uniref:DNA-binding LytR/AlgR family response regulator n=1 Tax=Aureibacter tunicatorum TaxID=866807 RepID=A0AAE3XSJ4_9BACT|nr:LytTR family DNA-binding domain-containing protein [Aureibacter tunicatorum]MDR6240769.1 DNA-binding LytR/AlgR family response regulator [Aureibacter tunicatorum]BDD06898.1 DNA-binding response regulator [Aureibacter tunicatorum]